MKFKLLALIIFFIGISLYVIPIFRSLEKKIGYKYTSSQLLKEIKNLDFLELKGQGYITLNERTGITDDFNNIFFKKTTKEIIS